jgi:hypothetical protein
MRFPLFLDVTQRRLVVTDVSGQAICPIFKNQAAKEDDSNNVFPKRRYVTTKPCCKTFQKSEDLIIQISEILKIQRTRCFLCYSQYGVRITDPITLKLEVRVSTSSRNTLLLDTFSHHSSLYQFMYLNFSRLQLIMNDT